MLLQKSVNVNALHNFTVKFRLAKYIKTYIIRL